MLILSDYLFAPKVASRIAPSLVTFMSCKTFVVYSTPVPTGLNHRILYMNHTLASIAMPRECPNPFLSAGEKLLLRSPIAVSHVQQAQPSLSLSRCMSIGSAKSPLNSSDSSCASAFRAITRAGINIVEATSQCADKHTFKSLLHIDSLFGTRLKVWNPALGLAKGHGSFRRDHPLALFHINLVAEDDLHRRSAAGPRSGCFVLTKGKFSGSRGLAWIRNSSLQLSSVSKLFELLTS